MRAVFLDRDGVVNRAVVREGRPYPPASLAELEIVPEAPEALARLKASGFLLLVVTNQPDVARGKAAATLVEQINVRLRECLPLDDILACYHDDADECGCRKPLPGLLLLGAERYRLDLAASFLIGDRWRDIGAAQAAGVRSVFIDYGYDEPRRFEPTVAVRDVSEAASWILEQG